MGKKARKTRWRTLPINADEQSDSEESNTTTTTYRFQKSYQQKNYLNRNNGYSSHSQTRRRYQYDSTRSSSTTSETKITFNEDEYTRITTPRQDVLFKKGYLSKPKSYQTQTSTGNSTTSTGNSTGNGTPDYQSTDLEYESQFVFPNGFVDQNGIYYVNSYEPYPVMVYNPHTYYPDITSYKTKRYSTGSLTESLSPNNEEVSSQDQSQSGGEQPNNFPDFPVYNMVYPYYVNGACPTQEIESGLAPRLKKRRRRKTSKTVDVQSSSEANSEVSDVEVEVLAEVEGARSDSCASPGEREDNNNECERLKYDLKPDAEEFVPRAYRSPPEYHLPPGLQYIKLPPHIVPVHIMPDAAAFIPPPTYPPVSYPNVVGFVPQPQYVEEEEAQPEAAPTVDAQPIDMQQIVSKLEEAAKEPKQQKYRNNNRPERQYNRKTANSQSNSRNNSWKSSPKRTNQQQQQQQEQQQQQQKKNYSEMVKVESPTLTRPPMSRPSLSRQSSLKQELPIIEVVEQVEKPPKLPNQWISVSSKKKRKNKNLEEPDEVLEVETVVEIEPEDVFESYDVNLLVDVVPPQPQQEQQQQEEVALEATDNSTIEEILTTIAANETANLELNVPVESIPEVGDIEKELILEEVKKPKKKSKKGSQKPVTKRVIITDVDLSETVEDTKAKIVEVVDEVATPEVEAEAEAVVVVEKKAPKKKKKKASKVQDVAVEQLNSQDSYDFLLDNSSLEESLEKTNMEVYQELDKIIQKGMYNSLEVKMKSMNIEKNDEFFKDVISNISAKEVNVEKGTFAKVPDFTKILQSTRKLYTNPTGFYPLRQMDLF